MLVGLAFDMGLRKSSVAFRFGVTCHYNESPIETFSIRSSSPNSIVIS